MSSITKGPFAEQIDDFVKFKRSTGYKYNKEYILLRQFDRYCLEKCIVEPIMTKEIVEDWCHKKGYENQLANNQRVSVIRQFAIHLSSLGYNVYIPIDIDGKRSHKSKYTAYIFTHDEIANIIKCSDKIYPNRQSTMHLVMPVLVRLLYSTGMRIMEALTLRLGNIDLNEGVIRLDHTKFDKDRLVPVSKSMLEILKNYCLVMHPAFFPDDYLFIGPTRDPYSHHNIYLRFREILQQAGIPHAGRGNGPRLHDIRHTFCCHTLQAAALEGKDLSAVMPVLSTYLGHESVAATGLYFRMTAEIYPQITNAVNALCAYVIPEVV